MINKGTVNNFKTVIKLIDKRRALRFLTVVLICALFVSLGYYETYRILRGNRISAQQTEILRSAGTVDYLLRESVDSIQMATYTLEAMVDEGASDEEIREYLVEQTDVIEKSVDEQYDGLYGFFNGQYMDGVEWIPPDDFVPQERPWYKKAIEGSGKVSMVAPYVDAESHNVIISICCMLPDHVSVVALDLYLDQIQKQVERDTLKNDWDYCMIVDADGNIIANSEKNRLAVRLQDVDDEIYPKIAENLEQTSDATPLVANGKRYRLFSSEVEEDWRIVAVMSEGKLVGNLRYYYLLNILTILAVAAALFFILYREEKERGVREDIRRQLMAIADIYALVYLIDLTQDSYMQITSGGININTLVGTRSEGAQNMMRAVLDVLVDSRFKSALFEFTNFATLRERLRKKNTITREFIDNQNRRCRGRFVVVERDETDTVTRVICMMELVDEREGVELT
ncbi:MAG: cache domain-containing protein [Lachnospiraceae bacterium]|nr:cache domain-containing protein [Lachnospiraceae bacterium]